MGNELNPAERAEVQRQVGFQWAKFAHLDTKADKARSLFRAKKVLSGLVHDMAALEDNPFTFPEVQTLLDGITVGGHKVSDEQQVVNTAEAWRKTFELVEAGRFDLTKDVFCEIHRFVAKGEALVVGEFRNGPVGIGGTTHRPPSHAGLDALYRQGFLAISKLQDVHERAFVTFLFGALNQFFWDGNKRTSRLMMAGELLRHGFDISNVPAAKKLEFNQKMIRFYDSKDGAEMMDFLRGCILD